MFKEGDFIIYGSNGVCQVEHIGSMDLQGVPGDKMYYTLVPVYEEKSRLFTPVDNHKVVMRPVISKQEACDLIDHMQEMQVFEIQNEKNRDTVFKEALKTGDCEELVRVIKTIYEKKQERERARRDVIPVGECIYFDEAYERGMKLQQLELPKLDVNMFAAIDNSLINDGCGLYRGRLILPYEHLSRFQND